MYGYCPIMSYRRDNINRISCEDHCKFYDKKREKCIIFAILEAKISNMGY